MTCASLFSCTYNSATRICTCTGRNPNVYLVNVTNPSTAGSYTFEVRGYAGSDLVASGSWSYALTCNLPCQTCLASAPDVCLSCYPTSITVTSSYLYQSPTCVQACAAANY
jgi:hypothetical protein